MPWKFDPNDNNPSLVQIMSCHRPGDEPLSEPMVAYFTDAYMRHLGQMNSHSMTF